MFSLQQPVLSNLFTFQTTALLLIYLQKSVHFTKLITWPSNKKVEVIPVCAHLFGNHSRYICNCKCFIAFNLSFIHTERCVRVAEFASVKIYNVTFYQVETEK